MQTILTVEAISKTYQRRGLFQTHRQNALTNVSQDVKAGEIVGLLGESGSGKSTLARIILRLEKEDHGRLIFEGQGVPLANRRLKDFRSKVQLILQDPYASLNALRTVRYHLERPLIRHRIVPAADREAELIKLLRKVSLSSETLNAYPSELSGGQRQRVAIARALAVRPRLLLADEATSMLDVSLRVDILNLLGDLRRQEGLSILLITHDIRSARYLADRLLVLKDGAIVEEGETEALLRNPQHDYTKKLLAACPPL